MITIRPETSVREAGAYEPEASPPPPRRGFAIRPKLRFDTGCGCWFWAARVSTRRALQVSAPTPPQIGCRGGTSERTASLVEPLPDGLQPRLELGVLLVHLLVRVLQERLEVLDPLVACEQFPLRERDVALQSRVLVDQLRRTTTSEFERCLPSDRRPAHLLLDHGQLVEVSGQEIHLALLRLAVRVLGQVAVVLASLVQRDLELDHLRAGVNRREQSIRAGSALPEAHLLTPVLQVAHEALLHRVKVGQLLRDRLVLPLQVLRGRLEVLPALDARGRDLECSL